MLEQFTQWLADLFRDTIEALEGLLEDIGVWFVDGVLGTIADIVSAIPMPSFMVAGLDSLFAGVDPGIIWGVSALGIPEMFTLIGAAYTFRIIRKFVTLFQW